MKLFVDISGMDELKTALRDFSERRLRAGLATALTRTAVSVRGDMARKIEQAFDRPTPYTMRQLRYVGATANRLAAAVGFGVVAITDEVGAVVRYADLGNDTPAAQYLSPHIEGGPRPVKRMEKALQAAGALPKGWMVAPGPGAARDAFGNVSRGQIGQILSQLRITLVAGATRNMSQDARKQITAQRKAGGRFFVMPVGSKARAGIYQREFVGSNITPVLWFVSKASYRKRFDFKQEANALAQRALPREVDRAMQEQAQKQAQKLAQKAGRA